MERQAFEQAAVPGKQGAWGDDPVQPEVLVSSRTGAAMTARSAQSGLGRVA